MQIPLSQSKLSFYESQPLTFAEVSQSAAAQTLHAPMSKVKDSEDVLSLLDSLGESAPPETTSTTVGQDPTANNENEKELLGFLDDLVKQPSRSQTPRPAATGTPSRTSRDLARNASAAVKRSPEKVIEKSVSAGETTAAPSVRVESAEGGGGGWLGGLWSMGSAAMKTAEQKVKELQQTEEAKAWEERVRGNVSVLGKFSIPPLSTHRLMIGNDLRSRTIPSLSSTFTSVLNTIAPPIEKHEGFLPHLPLVLTP